MTLAAFLAAAVISVTPHHGDRTTAPRVSWLAHRGTAGRRFAVSAIATRASRGERMPRGCAFQARIEVRNFTPGHRVTRHLRPATGWCRDLYRGRVTLAPEGPPCTAGPKHCTGVTPLVGRFRFRIR